MKSIDELYPQIEEDKTKQIDTNVDNNVDVVNGLVTAVKEVANVQSDVASKLVEKFEAIINTTNEGNKGNEGDEGDEGNEGEE